MDKEKLKEAIKAATANGRIRCEAAFRIAEEAGVPVGAVGRLIDEMGVKITGCRLGCF